MTYGVQLGHFGFFDRNPCHEDVLLGRIYRQALAVGDVYSGVGYSGYPPRKILADKGRHTDGYIKRG